MLNILQIFSKKSAEKGMKNDSSKNYAKYLNTVLIMNGLYQSYGHCLELANRNL